MKIALLDNGSLEAAAHRGLRAAAATIGARTGICVEAVSWRHSDRIPSGELDGAPAQTLGPWMRGRLRGGESEFVFIPFLISGEGAIAAAMRADLEAMRRDEGGFAFAFTSGLDPAAETIGRIVEARVREVVGARALRRPAVILVDHGGPSRASALLRDAVADEARSRLAGWASRVAASSMESPGGADFDFNQPLLENLLGSPGFDGGAVVIAPLFLSAGRHAGPEGDLARIARSAEARAPGLKCHFSGLIGDHPLAVEILARNLRARVPHPAIL